MSLDNESIRQLLVELGQGCEAVDGIQELGEGEWAMLMHESRRIDLDHDEGRGVLVLRTDVGRPEDARRLECYEALLSYNALWDQTGGARMALGGTGGDVALLMDVPLANLTWGRLDAVLANFCLVAEAWGELVAGKAASPEALQPAWPGQLA